jgi:Uma2 family endonuclease
MPVFLFQRNRGFYDAVQFRDEERIFSPTFPELELTAAQVLAARH